MSIAPGRYRVAMIMVGLPARGKTYIAYKVSRYLDWQGVNCRVFNVGEYRRLYVGVRQPHDFFDPTNKEGLELRRKCAMHALHDLLRWFEEVGSGVAIYDATNTTRERRRMLYEACRDKDIDVLFVESWCDDEELIEKNILEVKRMSPDYHGIHDEEFIINDFRQRIDHYKAAYEPLNCRPGGLRPHHASEMLIVAPNAYSTQAAADENEYDESAISYVKKINVGTQVVINRIQSFLESRIVFFLMNIHITSRSILFSRHGESLYNLEQRLGGDPGLSPNGIKYSEALPGLISKLMGDQQLTIWTSTLKRTIQTASKLKYPKLQWKALDELDAGLCDGLTYDEVELTYPEDYALRNDNKFEFRYRGGESYRDVVLRLEPVIMELERQQNILIVSHQAVLRCLYAYFLNVDPQELPYLKIPLHTVMKLTWTAYGCDIRTYKVDIAAVDTHRPKQTSSKPSSLINTAHPSGRQTPTSLATGGAGGGSTRGLPHSIPDSTLKTVLYPSPIPNEAQAAEIGPPLAAQSAAATIATAATVTAAKKATTQVPPLFSKDTHLATDHHHQQQQPKTVSPKRSGGLRGKSTAALMGESSRHAARRKSLRSYFAMSAQPVASPSLQSINPAELGDYALLSEPLPSDDTFRLSKEGYSPISTPPRVKESLLVSLPQVPPAAVVFGEDAATGSTASPPPAPIAPTARPSSASPSLPSDIQDPQNQIVVNTPKNVSFNETITQGQLESETESSVKSEPRPTIFHEKTFDKFHVEGHGDVKVTESKPKVSIRYTTNPDIKEQMLTKALKSELIGIDPNTGDGGQDHTE